jgi:hypothetical protein
VLNLLALALFSKEKSQRKVTCAILENLQDPENSWKRRADFGSIVACFRPAAGL